MKVVIDISENEYKFLQQCVKSGVGSKGDKYIANGVPLPKGHGDLIDRDELKISYETSLKQALRNNDRGIDLSKAADIPCERFNQFIDKEPAVIPSDKGE